MRDSGLRTDSWPLEAALLKIVFMKQLHGFWFLLLFPVKRSTKLLASEEENHTLALCLRRGRPSGPMLVVVTFRGGNVKSNLKRVLSK